MMFILLLGSLKQLLLFVFDPMHDLILSVPQLIFYPDYIIPLWMLLGLILGSVATVVIHRLPIMVQTECSYVQGTPPNGVYNLWYPGSHCPHCHHPIHWRHRLPLLSYLIQRGRCRYCDQPMGKQYLFIELSSAILMGVCAWRFHSWVELLGASLFVMFALILAWIDINTYLLPDRLTQPMIWLGLLFNGHGGWVSLYDAVLACVFAYLVLWCINQFSVLIFNKQGMGQGDFKYFAALGAWLGWQALPIIMLGASLLGMLMGLTTWCFSRYKHKEGIAFGPYLSITAMAYLFLLQ